MVNSYAEQFTGENLYYECEKKKYIRSQSQVKDRFGKSEVLSTVFLVSYKNFRLGPGHDEMQNLAVNDDFFQLAHSIFDDKLTFMRDNCKTYLMEMGDKYGLSSQEYTAAEQLELDRASRLFRLKKQKKSKFEVQVDTYLQADLSLAWTEFLRKDRYTLIERSVVLVLNS